MFFLNRILNFCSLIEKKGQDSFESEQERYNRLLVLITILFQKMIKLEERFL